MMKPRLPTASIQRDKSSERRSRDRPHRLELVLLAWSLTALLLVAAFTANLASNLVAATQQAAEYASYADALRRDAVFCVGAGYDTGLVADGPVRISDMLAALGYGAGALSGWMDMSMRIIGNGHIESEFALFAEGACDVVISSRISADRALRNGELNAGCNLRFLGEALSSRPSGWLVWTEAERAPLPARGGAAPKCTRLVDDVLAYWYTALSAAGATEALYEAFLESEATTACGDGAADAEASGAASSAFFPSDLAGIFVLHALLCGCACAVWGFNRAAAASATRGAKDDEPAGAASSQATPPADPAENGENVAVLHEKVDALGRLVEAMHKSMQEQQPQPPPPAAAVGYGGGQSDASTSSPGLIFCNK